VQGPHERFTALLYFDMKESLILAFNFHFSKDNKKESLIDDEYSLRT
jgi:hypothetical protein